MAKLTLSGGKFIRYEEAPSKPVKVATKAQKAEENRRRTNITKWAGDNNAYVIRNIMAYEEEEGEREKFPDALNMKRYLDEKRRKCLKASEVLFKYGISLEGKYWFVNSKGLLDIEGDNDINTMKPEHIMQKLMALPTVYVAINNLQSDVWSLFGQVKAEFEEWAGRQWDKANKPGAGLYSATVKKVEAFIHKQPPYIEYTNALIELKTVGNKLRALSIAAWLQSKVLMVCLNRMDAQSRSVEQFKNKANQFTSVDMSDASKIDDPLVGNFQGMDLSETDEDGGGMVDMAKEVGDTSIGIATPPATEDSVMKKAKNKKKKETRKNETE